MTTFVCVKHGNLYGPEYVNILFNMVARNLPDKHKFVCFTENSEGINHEIEIRALPEGLHGWWNKLYLFKEGVFEAGERIVYLDLDTAIVGPLDGVFNYNGPFAILRDFYRSHGLQSSIMAWSPTKETSSIWQNYVGAGYPIKAGGDQEWIELCFYGNGKVFYDTWQDLYPGAFHSYKVSCKKIFPKNTKVVVFHGEPRPHQVKTGWVPQIWKLGGGTTLELMAQGNTCDETLIKNIQHSMTLDAPLLMKEDPHEGVALIIGGGPSLNDSLAEIAWRSQSNTIFTTNGVKAKLDEAGVKSDYHVILDARGENLSFVPEDETPCIYASQCHPQVLDKAKNLTIWHSYADGMEDVVSEEKRDFTYIGGGSTVGLKAICLAFVMGYRIIHIYGFDSCYKEGSHHAYPQSLNDGEKLIDVNFEGVDYVVAPWMAKQVDEFKDLACELVNLGAEIHVHGDGLLQEVAKKLRFGVSAASIRAEEILKRIKADNPIGVEVGVFAGDLSSLLLKKEDLTLYMVDPWTTSEQDSEYAKSGDFHASLAQETQDAYYEKTRHAVNFACDRANIIRKTSIEAAKGFDDLSLDFVFIDADHSYEGCNADIEAWFPKVKKGGILSGHDYNNTDYPCFGVDKAVDEFCAKHGFSLDLGENFTWFVQLPA